MPTISAETPGQSTTDVAESFGMGREETQDASSLAIEVGDSSSTTLRDNTAISESVVNCKDDFTPTRVRTDESAVASTNVAEYNDEDGKAVDESLSVPSNDCVKLSPSQVERVEVSERLDQIAAMTDKLIDQEVFHSLEDASVVDEFKMQLTRKQENDDNCIQENGQDQQQPVNDEEEELEWLDILGNGDILKKIISQGEEKTRPDRGQVVTVNLKGHLENDAEVEFLEDFSFTLGDADVVQGLELAIPLMNKGEISKIAIKPRFAYGTLGREPDIPSDSTIIYTVKLLNVNDEPDFESLPLSEKMRIGTDKKDRGNFWFSRGDYSQSVVCYRRALDFLDDDSQIFTDTPETLQNMLEDRLKVYNNLALAQLKLDAFEAAMKSVDHVLRVQPQNVKALFRKGKIYAAQGCVDDAISYMKRALKLEPEMKIIHQELARLTAKKTHENVSERELYRKMLGEQRHNVGKKKSKSQFKIWGSFLGGLAAVVVGIIAYRQYHDLKDDENFILNSPVLGMVRERLETLLLSVAGDQVEKVEQSVEKAVENVV